MNESKYYYFDKLKHIYILGASNFFDEVIAVNNKLKLSTNIISTSHQVKEFKLGKKVIIHNKLDTNFIKTIKKNKEIKNTLFVSFGARWIFKNDTIEKLFNNNLLNFHCTRLPYDSGGGGHSWKIMRQDRIDNQLVHIVDEKIDAGPILFNKSRVIPHKYRLPFEIEEFRVKNLLTFYEEFIKKLTLKKKFLKKFQPSYIGRYNPRLNTSINGWIDWNLKSYDLINFINAFDKPYLGALTMINNQKVFIKKAQIHGGESANHPFMTGIISRHDKNWLIVSTKDQNSLIVEVVNNISEKNIIDNLKPGDRFYTPTKYLENAKNQRVRYNSKGLNIL
jgi:methionyl-tRNA formyltransferase